MRILCSRVLHHHHHQQHHRIIKQQVIPCSFRRHYRSSDDDSEEELDGITSRLESLHDKFHDRLLALRDDRIKRGKSTADLDHHLARLAVMDSDDDDDDDDFLDDDSDEDDDYDQEAQLKEERRREKMMDHFDKLRTSYNKHIQNGPSAHSPILFLFLFHLLALLI